MLSLHRLPKNALPPLTHIRTCLQTHTQSSLLFTITLLALSQLSALAAPQTIVPGEIWRDTAGDIIQAHGAGMIRVGRIYYWFGEDHTGEVSDQSFQNVKCYSSTDLAHWTFRRNALTRQPDGDLGPNRVIERPKVIYNRHTHLYVMYMHADSRNYREAKVGVATCSRVDGKYAYVGSFRPMGHQSRDMGLFQDTDGAGYLIFEDRASGVRIEKLSPDYLTIESEVVLIPHAYEALAVVKNQGVYYLLGSHLTGWSSNSNQYATAASLAGPWSNFADVAPQTKNTYDSQTASILPVVGRRTTSYLYLGDRWKGSNLQDSRYIWLPLAIGDHTMTLPPFGPWTIDTASPDG